MTVWNRPALKLWPYWEGWIVGLDGDDEINALSLDVSLAEIQAAFPGRFLLAYRRFSMARFDRRQAERLDKIVDHNGVDSENMSGPVGQKPWEP